MNFFEYYKSIEDVKLKRRLRKSIIEVCEIEPATFYTWLNREIIPTLKQKIISAVLGMSQDSLFPQQEVKITEKKEKTDGLSPFGLIKDLGLGKK